MGCQSKKYLQYNEINNDNNSFNSSSNTNSQPNTTANTSADTSTTHSSTKLSLSSIRIVHSVSLVVARQLELLVVRVFIRLAHQRHVPRRYVDVSQCYILYHCQ